MIHRNKAQTAKQLLTLFRRGVEPKPLEKVEVASGFIFSHSQLEKKCFVRNKNIRTFF